MKLAYVQFAPVLCDREATLDRLDGLIDRAAKADLIVLPELASSGYNFGSRERALAVAEELPDGPFTRFLIEKSQKLGAHIVAGLPERADDRLFNSSILVGPDGLVGAYRKLHLFWNEKDIFEPGDLGVPVWDIGSCRVAMLICFDWIFPEVWRMAALEGADVICHPSNLVLPGLAQSAAPINAVTNRVYVVTANRIGTEGELTFTGMSTIADPKAQVLAQAPAAEDAVTLVEIDPALARNKSVTPRNDVLADRRPDIYGPLVEK